MVTAFERIDQTLQTLQRIESCEPAPAQILVHVDGHDVAVSAAIRAACPRADVMASSDRVGPGGGRNRMMSAANCDLVASFDDDSYPLDRDYFGRVVELFARFPGASVITARVFHADDALAPAQTSAVWQSDFSGGACVYRREHFLETGGYVALPTAYGMEEVDLALRLHARGRRVLGTDWLRVFHDTDRRRHADPEVTAASVANIALLTFLRYPVILWGVGGWQMLNRIQWLLRHGRRRGIADGLLSCPRLTRAHRSQRHQLPASMVLSYLRLRRAPRAASWAGQPA